MSSYTESIAAHAVLYVERFGFSVIPMSSDKRPLISWTEYQSRRPTVKEILKWPKQNLAIITGSISGICVVDCESRDDAEWFYRNRGKTSVIVQTRRGFHLYFRHPGQRVMNGQKIEDRYDVRGDGGYVLAPPSRHREGAYRWVKPITKVKDLPVFKMEWRPETRNTFNEKAIHDGVKYISHIRAVSGSGGHNDTYRAACVLKDSGIGETEALAALHEWNRTNADPPWSDRELLHKIKEAYA